MKKWMILSLSLSVLAFVGCAENRGGAHYGAGRQSGSATSAPMNQSTDSSNWWYSGSSPESTNKTTSAGDPATGTQTGNSTNDRLR